MLGYYLKVGHDDPLISHPNSKFTITVRGCIQKLPDWPPGASSANGTALCHKAQLYRYFVSQSS